jgi:NADH-quinone oxidoreductase subunit H
MDQFCLYLSEFFWHIIAVVAIIIPLIVCVAYLTYAERRVIAFVQLRRGPNVVGISGLLQPIADAIKLMTKEVIIPGSADKVVFLIAPIITFVLSLMGWAVIPFSASGGLADINVGVLYLLAISSLGIYGIIMAGWASNSKYPFLGSIRSAAQMISYEISIGIIICCVLLACGSLNLKEIVLYQQKMPWIVKAMLFPMMVVFFISVLAETNRHPFDLPESEAELVAGYNVEYSSMPFALFFLGEYANMILMSSFTVILFWSGWLPILDIKILYLIPGFIWFALKVAIILLLFLLVRAAFPRYRYDQLMYLGWKCFLPLTLSWLVMMSGVMLYFDLLPN